MRAVPVIALTGFLGAGKTTLLNHLLRTPGARIGVVINDFGEINVDAALVSGQVDEAASLSGGCICCLDDSEGLESALRRLANPALDLDAIIVEASGLADPVALQRIIGFSVVPGVRAGGVVDVIDALNHFDTVDRDPMPPLRYAAASLVVINKLDQVSDAEASIARIAARVRERNLAAAVIGATGGKVDPELLFDIAGEEPTGQLTFRELLVETQPHDHEHAHSVSLNFDGPVAAGGLVDLLESPPAGVYRMKGIVGVGKSWYVVNVVGATVHVARTKRPPGPGHLVAIGMDLDVDLVRSQMTEVISRAPADGLPRLRRYVSGR